MKITVINGNSRHGSTWHCMDMIIKEIAKFDETDVNEFFLPKDMPHFCNGCFSCIVNGEQTCPHFANVTTIINAITESDVVILTSPVYAMDISGQLKALLDHMCFMWMSHRPDPRMFNKIGVTISTTAGAGLSHATKTMKNSLTFWGVKKIYSFKYPVSAMRWTDISEKRQSKITKNAAILAKQITESVKNTDKLPQPLFRRFFFKIMTDMMNKNTWNLYDRNHWEQHGWLNGTKPF